MKNSLDLESARREASESPTAWFATLELARARQDYQLMAQAERELERLGVAVQFARPETRRQGGDRD